MADRPILFSAPMIRAILREIEKPGTGKTQTRRVAKFIEPHGDDHWHIHNRGGGVMVVAEDDVPIYGPDYAPYWVGDRLWVREAWTARMTHGWTIADARSRIYQEQILYRADRVDGIDGWWPSIHMPREFSRVTLIVTDVRVQRLQDISEADTRAEGIQCRAIKCGDGVERVLWFGVPQAGHEWSNGQGPIQAFADLWDSINNHRGLCADDAPSGWTANPWIVAITFRPILANIDALKEAA